MFVQQQTLRPQEHADEIAFLGDVIQRLRTDANGAAAMCIARLCALEARAKPALCAFNPREEEERASW